MSKSLPPRLPLRIPSGWLVRHNELRAIDPDRLADGDPDWWLLSQDLLQLEQVATGLVVDVGWYPGESPQGEFAIAVVLERDWEHPLARFAERTPGKLVEQLEQLLEAPPAIPVERLVERLDHPDPQIRGNAAAELARRGAIDTIDAIRDAMGREQDWSVVDRLEAAMKSLIGQRKQQP